MKRINTRSLSESDKLAHNAFRAFLGTAVIMVVMAIAIRLIYRADPSSSASSVIQIGLVAVAALISAGLARRGQPIVGYFMTIAAWQLLLLYNVTFIVAGMGLIIATLSLFLTLGLTTFTLPKKYLSWAVAFSIPLAILIFAIDIFSTTTRIISSDEVITTTGIIGAVFTLIYGFLIARQFRNFSLRSKMIIAFVGISIFIATGISFIATTVLTENLTREVGENFEAQAETLHREVNLFFHEKVSQIQAIAAVASIKEQVAERNSNYSGNDDEILSQIQLLDEQWIAAESNDDPLIAQIITTDNRLNPATSQLQDYLAAFPFHSEIFVTDRYGATLAATGRLSDYYQADEGWWQAAWNNGAGAVYISEPEFDESAGISAVLIAVPIYSAENEVIGIVRSTLGVNELFDLIEEVTLDKTGHAILLNSVGEVLFDPFANEGIGSAGLAAELRQSFIDDTPLNTVHFKLTPDENGNETFFGYASSSSGENINAVTNAPYLQIDKTVRNLRWITVVRQEAEEALISVDSINRTIQLSSLGAIGLAALLAALFAHYITSPIQRLNKATQAVGAGNLNVSLPNSDSDDEVGQLVSNFKLMVDRLKSTLGNLQARTRDLNLTAEIGREVTQVHDLEQTLKDAVELIRERFELYYSQIYLTDPIKRSLILRAGTGEVGQKLVQTGHRLLIGPGSLNGSAATYKQPVIVADTSQSKRFRAHPLLPRTRSEMVVPLLVGDEVLGVLDLQSEQAGRFNPEQVAGFVALAAQLAIAIQNAALFTEVKRARDEVRAQAKQLTAVGWQEFFNAVDRDEHLVTAYDVSADAPLSEPLTATLESHHLAVPITVAGAAVGTIRLEDVAEREWAGNEVEVAQAIADKIGRQVENLRLVNEGKRSQFKAEQATRRLTREGWESYLNVVELSGDGYVYNQNRVQSLSNEEPIDAVNISQSLAIRGEEFGELVLGGVDRLDEEKRALVQAVAQKVSDRMEKLRLSQQSELALAQTEDQTRRLTHLNKLGNKLGTIDSVDEAFTAITQSMNDIINHDRLSLTLLTSDEENLEVYALDGEVGAVPVGATLPLVGTAVGTAVTKRQHINIPDLHQSDYLESKQLASQGLRATLIAPLITAHGALGTLNLSSNAANTFDAQDENLIQQIAPLLASTIEGQRLFQQAQRRASELETVAQVGTAAATLFQPQDLLQEVVDLTQTRFELYHAHIYLFNNSKDTLLLTVGAGEIGRKIVAENRNIPLAAQESLVASVARTGKGAIRNYETAEEAFMPHPLLSNTQSELAVAIALGDEVLGVLNVKSDVFDYFDEANLQTLTTLASQVAVALQNARSFEQSQKALRELDMLTRRLTREGWDSYLVDQESLMVSYDLQKVALVEDVLPETAVSFEDGDLLTQPLLIQGEPIGQLRLATPKLHEEGTAEIMSAVAERLSTHLENLRLNEQTQSALTETEALFIGSERIVLSDTENDILHALIQSTMMKNLDRANIFMFDQPVIDGVPEDVTAVAVWENEDVQRTVEIGTRFLLDEVPFMTQIQPDFPMIVRDVRQDTRVDEQTRQILEGYGMRSFIMFPLVAGNQWLGIVSGQSAEPLHMDEIQARRSVSLVSQSAVVLRTMLLYRQEQARARQEQLLREITAKVRSSADVDTIMQTAVTEIGRALGRTATVSLNKQSSSEV